MCICSGGGFCGATQLGALFGGCGLGLGDVSDSAVAEGSSKREMGRKTATVWCVVDIVRVVGLGVGADGNENVAAALGVDGCKVRTAASGVNGGVAGVLAPGVDSGVAGVLAGGVGGSEAGVLALSVVSIVNTEMIAEATGTCRDWDRDGENP